MTNVLEVRDRLGGKLYVRHVRELKTKYWNPDFNGEDNLLTRREFENLSRGSGHKFSDVVQPRGGFTEIKVVLPDGTEYHGKHNFGHKPFNRKIGVQSALGRLLKKANIQVD